MNLSINEHFATAAVAICSALFSAIVAIVVPVYTKRQDRKLQADRIKHELKETRKLEALEAFVRHVDFTIKSTPNNYSADGSALLLLIHIDKALHHFIDEITDCLAIGEYLRAQELLRELCISLQSNNKR